METQELDLFLTHQFAVAAKARYIRAGSTAGRGGKGTQISHTEHKSKQYINTAFLLGRVQHMYFVAEVRGVTIDRLSPNH